MIDLKKVHRYSDDLYDLTFMCNGKNLEVRRCVVFDKLEIEIKNFCGYVYKVSEIYQSVNYVSSLVVNVQPISFYSDTDSIKIAAANTNIAKFRMILIKAIDAHRSMINQTEYDYAFRQGLLHALSILDNFCNDEFKKACIKDINKKFGGLNK